MKNQIKRTLNGIKWVIMRKIFGSYSCDAEHQCDGFFYYDEERFKSEKPDIDKILQQMRRNGIRPNKGDQLCTEDGIWHIMDIAFFNYSFVVYVDEDRTNVIDKD